ncbi:hypothetical protein ACIBBD_14385 [Streptomyces sp. NPDC051315]|uniref:hypothetical protein n=1 Tax=Streptomyces sp. NPDC051315 TaxID=3365650 RepID=UPI0037B13B0B
MRGLPVRRTASTALCATLVLGIAAPTALAADGDAVGERTRAAPRAPVPGADALLTQLEGLGGLGAVLAPVADLLDTAVQADNGPLGADQAKQVGDAVAAAVAKIVCSASATSSGTAVTNTVTTSSPGTSATNTVTTSTGTTATTATGTATSDAVADTATTGTATTATDTAGTATLPAGTPPSPTRSGDDTRVRSSAVDLDDALAALKDAVHQLQEAVTSDEEGTFSLAITAVDTAVDDLLAALTTWPATPALATTPELPSGALLPAS